MSIIEIEKRLIAVENELARLKAERSAVGQGHPIHALDRIHGTFENDDAFKEAMRLGRKWRTSQGPRGVRKAKAKRK
jgi:hypothetical protein